MSIRCIFFDLHGTLIEAARLHPCLSLGAGALLAARYGGDAGQWAAFHQQVVAEWDIYFADLNLSEDEGLDALMEGLYRTTRALFRLAGIPEPPPAEIRALGHDLAAQAPAGCPALYPDAQPALAALSAAGYTLGIASHALVGQARGILAGSRIAHFFAGPILGPDATGEFEKNAAFYAEAARQAGCAASACLVIDDHPAAIAGAQAAGMQALWLHRAGSPGDDGLRHLEEVLSWAARL